MILSALRGERRGLEQTFISDPSAWFTQMFGGGTSSTGIDVTELTAMGVPAIYSAVAGVAETMGSLPLKVHRRLEGGGTEEATEHPLYDLLHLAPNNEITTMQWREMKQAHLMLNGRAYSEIVRDGMGKVTALWPIVPQRVRAIRDPSGQLLYRITVPYSSISGPTPGGPIRREQTVILPASQILHLRALSLDGVEGLGRLRLHAESMGLSRALELFGAKFFNNSATLGGYVEHPTKLSDTAYARIQEGLNNRFAGLTNAHRIAILEEGMKFHESQMPNNRAQYLESRDHQVGETARMMRVPGVFIGYNDKSSTYASAEQFFLSYVVHTVRPWSVRWDQALTMTLLTQRERNRYFIEHNLDGLLRGDAMTRAQSLQTQFQNGALTINEWRAIENRNPTTEAIGDKHFVMANVVPAEMAGQQQQAAPTKETPTPDPDEDEDDDEIDSQEREDKEESARARLLGQLLEDTAQRAYRMEMKGVRNLSRDIAPTEAAAEAWRTTIDEFYARHAAYLAEMFHVSLDDARGYTTDHRAQLLAEGVGVFDRWEREARRDLIGLAAGRVAA
jgi:HK97 family phage portal protein